MNKLHFTGVLLLMLVACQEGTAPIQQVNVFNGTALSGNTYPGATVPFGMVQLSPDTDAGRASGYHDSDTSILGFSHTHLSGTGCPDFGDFLVTPGLDSVTALPFSHKDEFACPGYYRVSFPAGITAELTALEWVGAHRYTFERQGVPVIQVNAAYGLGGWSHTLRAVLSPEGEQGFSGERCCTAWAKQRDLYLSAVFDRPYARVQETAPGILLFSFPEGTREVNLCVGLSGVGIDQARHNLDAQAGSFDHIRRLAQARWEEALGSIRVSGGPCDVFYTQFYHTFLTPNLISDVDDRRAYSTFSLWDTFRSWHPLQTLLNPTLVADMVNSMLDQYRYRGELPIWPLASDETGCMIGYHSVSVIADAWLHGIRGFDGEEALQAMVASSNRNKVNASELYNTYGYIPAEMKTEAVSQTLEFAYDDWCIAQMAESLGHWELAAEYYARSLRYRALFDPLTGFLRGKKADGNWTEPFDPLSRSRDYTEATAWHYRFFIPHDVAGLQALMGGREALYAALDSLFTYAPQGQKSFIADVGGLIGQYAHGNEPGQHMPYLFHWVGAPSRTQEVVRTLLTQHYSASPEGLCGNEDCGQMGAWYVLSALGLYPVCPGSGEYHLVAPLFKEAEIRLGNGKTLIIKANRPEWKYIASVTLNGEPVKQHYLTYEQIMGGGVLEYKLSALPSHDRDHLPAPYSLTRDSLVSSPAILGELFLFADTAEVTLTSRTPGARIHYTLDGSEPTEDTPLYVAPFVVRESGLVRARAFKDGLQPSPLVFHTAHKRYLYPATIDRSALQPGCRYTYHAANFVALSQIEEDPPEADGVLPSPSIAGASDQDHFAFCFFGYLDVPEDGLWSFSLTSDDDAALYIDGELVINEGTVPLQKGLHAYKLLYFEYDGSQTLSWAWKAPREQNYSPIPENRLFWK